MFMLKQTHRHMMKEATEAAFDAGRRAQRADTDAHIDSMIEKLKAARAEIAVLKPLADKYAARMANDTAKRKLRRAAKREGGK